jgi:hypothetical protein
MTLPDKTHPKLALALAIACVLALPARDAWAGCDAISPIKQNFRCDLGSMSRPFFAPNDTVQMVPTACDEQSATLRVNPSDPSSACVADDGAYSVYFFQPEDAAVNAVVVAQPSLCTVLAPQVAALRNRLQAQTIPGTAECISDPNFSVDVAELPGGATECRVNGIFPDTHAVALDPAFPEFTFTGATRVVVARAADPLPDLVDTSCADAIGSEAMIGCCDRFFEIDGSCNTAPDNRHSLFEEPVALSRANDVQEQCSTFANPVSLCDDTLDPDTLFALDSRGALFMNWRWEDILSTGETELSPALVNFDTSIEAFLGGGQPIALTSDQLFSLTADGVPLPPVLNPASITGASSLLGVDALRLGGTTDARRTIIMALPGDPAAFDLSHLVAASGPGVIPADERAAAHNGYIQFGGLCEEPSLICIERDEVAVGFGYNADPDQLDSSVLSFLDAETNQQIFTGRNCDAADAPCGIAGAGEPTEGLASAQVTRPPFRFPAFDAGDDCVVYAVSESAENETDTSGNQRVFENVIQVLCVDDASGLVELASGATQSGLGISQLAVDAAPAILSSPAALVPRSLGLRTQSFAISDGLVYAFAPEAVNARQLSKRLDLDPDGLPGAGTSGGLALAAGGGFAVYSSTSDLDLASGRNKAEDIFRHDLAAGFNEIGLLVYNDAPKSKPRCEFGNPTQPKARGGQGAPTVNPDTSADGRIVCGESLGNNLVDQDSRERDTNDTWDVSVLDFETCLTERVSVASDGTESTQPSYNWVGWRHSTPWGSTPTGGPTSSSGTAAAIRRSR